MNSVDRTSAGPPPTRRRWLLSAAVLFAVAVLGPSFGGGPAAATGRPARARAAKGAIEFSGVLEDRDGGAVAGQEVKLTDASGNVTAQQTGADGSFDLVVAGGGSYTLNVNGFF